MKIDRKILNFTGKMFTLDYIEALNNPVTADFSLSAEECRRQSKGNERRRGFIAFLLMITLVAIFVGGLTTWLKFWDVAIPAAITALAAVILGLVVRPKEIGSTVEEVATWWEGHRKRLIKTGFVRRLKRDARYSGGKLTIGYIGTQLGTMLDEMADEVKGAQANGQESLQAKLRNKFGGLAETADALGFDSSNWKQFFEKEHSNRVVSQPRLERKEVTRARKGKTIPLAKAPRIPRVGDLD